jgi:D-tyrosyl-tRNA(Tyr) deacylase
LINLLQRVAEASVEVDGAVIGAIGQGILVLVGVQADDDDGLARASVDRLLNYRVFADADGRMNLSARDIGGGLLLVPQFTLAADTRKGRRPSFTSAASPAHGRAIFESMLEYAAAAHRPVASGRFGADMQVRLVNDGPVTFILD